MSVSPITITEHPERVLLNNEVHSRPFVVINSPSRCSHIAILHGSGKTRVSLAQESEYLERLYGHFGKKLSDKEAFHQIEDFGTFRLKWERHTEFSSYSFIREGKGKAAYQDMALSVVPEKWLEEMPGEMLVGIHLYLGQNEDCSRFNKEQITNIFGTNSIVGAMLSENCASAWTDFHIHGDGFSRILVNDISMNPRQAGRVIQRLMEIETYRMMSLLAMPLTVSVAHQTGIIEQDLSENVHKMLNVYDPKEEHKLLETLTRLAAAVEQLSAETSFRFNASKAYYALVRKRVEDIKEKRIEGIQRISSFMDRRLAPAMRTVVSMDHRISILSKRVNRASNLLQARINTTLQSQNKELLISMDRRANLQLRLQQTVEGLSVVAISYYALGIINIMAKAVAEVMPNINSTLITGISAPLVVGLVFWGMHRMRKFLLK